MSHSNSFLKSESELQALSAFPSFSGQTALMNECAPPIVKAKPFLHSLCTLKRKICTYYACWRKYKFGRCSIILYHGQTSTEGDVLYQQALSPCIYTLPSHVQIKSKVVALKRASQHTITMNDERRKVWKEKVLESLPISCCLFLWFLIYTCIWGNAFIYKCRKNLTCV